MGRMTSLRDVPPTLWIGPTLTARRDARFGCRGWVSQANVRSGHARYEFSREDAFRSLRETARLPHAVGPGSSADRSQLVNGAAIILAAVPSPGRGTKKLRQTRRLAHRYLGIEPGRRQGQVAFDDRDERQHGHSDRTDA